MAQEFLSPIARFANEIMLQNASVPEFPTLRVRWLARFPSLEDSYVEKIQNRTIKRSTICVATLLCLFALVATAADQTVVLLWPNGAPGSEGKTAPEKVRLTPDGERVISSVHQPSITVYLPSKETATGAAVVVAPGGGHAEL
jgi:hypothetical protein